MARAREYTNVGALTWADLGTLSDPCYLVEVATNWVVYLAIYIVLGTYRSIVKRFCSDCF